MAGTLPEHNFVWSDCSSLQPSAHGSAGTTITMNRRLSYHLSELSVETVRFRRLTFSAKLSAVHGKQGEIKSLKPGWDTGVELGFLLAGVTLEV